MLGGCANGDFGEVHPFLVADCIHDWVGPAAITGTKASPSSFELTDDERQLRDLAYPLIEPSYDRRKCFRRWRIWPDRARSQPCFRSHRLCQPAARRPLSLGLGALSHLIDDIRNDTTRLPHFFETATRFLDIDRKRKLSLAYISDLSQAEHTEALRRINVNAAIVSWVRSRLKRRGKLQFCA